jgi:dTDP-4-amino-4,6-dideoxygalactose transaminase
MHTFGFPARIKEIANICSEWNINLIEDAAESLGSFADKKHTGRFGQSATLSFNGNKVITTGGGGMIITDDQELASLAKHITTTAKSPHPYEFFHDNIGYNYRMPNINAALGCAQMEYLDKLLIIKQEVSRKWSDFFISENTKFVEPIHGNKSNYWLNAIVLNSKNERDEFIQYTNDNNVMTRPIWTLMSKIPMFKDCQSDDLENSLWLEERVVNIPSSVPDGTLKQS